MENTTTTEISRRHFLARSTGLNRDGVWVIGPVLVDVVVTQTTRDDGTVCTPSYSVEVDGRHQFGGFAHHLDSQGLPPGAAPLTDWIDTDDHGLERHQVTKAELAATEADRAVEDAEARLAQARRRQSQARDTLDRAHDRLDAATRPDASTPAGMADEQRRAAARLYRDASRHERDATRYAVHADSVEAMGHDAAALRRLAEAGPGRAAKCREWARACAARARRYDEMARDASYDVITGEQFGATVELDTTTHDDQSATELIARLASQA
jgi:hypothetical protein